MKLRHAVASALLIAGPGPLVAQVGSGGSSVRSLPASTRAMALGGAYMMNAGHADAIFYHPALLATSGGFGLDLQRWGGASSAATASAAVAWLGGGVGVGLQTLQRATTAGSEDALFEDGPGSATERVAALGYARRLLGVRMGVAAKLVDAHVGGTRSSGILFDVGAASQAGPLTLGLTVQELGDDPLDGEDAFDFGRMVLGAGAYGRPVGIFDLGLTGAVTHDGDDAWVGGGLEIGYWPVSGRTFVGRIGVQRVPDGSEASPITFGFAFWGDDLVLEWAYRDFGDLDEGTHRFGVRWR